MNDSFNLVRCLTRFNLRVSPYLILPLTLFLVDCGGGGNGYDGPPDCSPFGNINFSIDSAYIGSSGTFANLRGTAFSDPPVSGCPAGADTSMTLRWTNESSGVSGTGRLFYGWTIPGLFQVSQCEHYWEASVPVISGRNIIAVTAAGATHSCTGSAEVQARLVVLSTIPQNFVSNVPIATTVSTTFNGQVDPLTVDSSSFNLNSPYGAPAGTFTISGPTITFAPGNSLYANTTYTGTITPDIKDGNGIAAVRDTWSFTTALEADNTPPKVISISPANGSTSVAVGAAITATFSQAMQPSTINGATFFLSSGVPGAVSFAGTKATLKPTGNLAYATTYTATIATGVTNANGVALAAPYTWTFTTGAAPPPPTVLSTTPANNAPMVPVNTTIKAIFDQPLMASSLNSSTFSVDHGITGMISYGETYQSNSFLSSNASLIPSNYLGFSTTYTATITTGVMNSGGVPMVAPYSWSFTTAAVGSMFIVPDTGQTLCSTSSGSLTSCAGTGQDGAYSINPPSYTDNGDGTVTDNVTGLVWQKRDDGLMRDSISANNYCSSLNLGGQTGWRLPSLVELISIVNYGALSPSINPTYFPGTGIYYYWTSTPYASDPAFTWSVYFAWGTTDHSSNNGTSSTHYARCIRGGQAAPQLTNNADGTITDNNTLLTWQQGETSVMTWQSALSYCESLALATRADWRLPNAKELVSLVDYAKRGPSINATMFPNAKSVPYWSSTSDNLDRMGAWTVNFLDGGLSDTTKSTGAQVRCVRGSQ